MRLTSPSGKMPKDFKVTNISRPVGKEQVVDELIISFTHDREIEYSTYRKICGNTACISYEIQK
jgi:hypothetical protein